MRTAQRLSRRRRLYDAPKGLVLILVLPLLMGAAIDLGTFEYHASTQTYEAANAGACNLSGINAGPNVDDTTADASVTLSGQNCAGTLHVCLDTAGDAVSRAGCIANTGMVDKNTASPSGEETVSFTGASTFTGSAETQYRIQAHLVPTAYPSRVIFDSEVTPTFTTNAVPGGGGTDLTGAGLFVALADAGNTDETPTGTAGTATSGCTSMAASCSLFSHIGTPATGQNVYLAEGGVWADTTWTISHDGTSGDAAEIGCYFDEGDDDVNPVLCTSF